MIDNISDIIMNKKEIESDNSILSETDTSSNISNISEKYSLTNQENKSFGTKVAENDIEELFLNNEKKEKNKMLINKLIQINKMKKINEYLEDVVKYYQNEYDILINNYKNKYNCLNVLLKHLNKLEKNKKITKSLKKELKEEKKILIGEIIDVKNILDQLTI
tara:strand:+ start:173 stop:661 length:489 start_codon:yes stop_codon:yes gene_type:complete